MQVNTALLRLWKEMKEFKDEMKDFKDEMKDFKREIIQEQKERNKQWANLAKKMGTITEDLINPATRPAIQRFFKCAPYYKGLNILKRIGWRDMKLISLLSVIMLFL